MAVAPFRAGGVILASACSPSARRGGASSKAMSIASCSVTRSLSRWIRATRPRRVRPGSDRSERSAGSPTLIAPTSASSTCTVIQAVRGSATFRMPVPGFTVAPGSSSRLTTIPSRGLRISRVSLSRPRRGQAASATRTSCRSVSRTACVTASSSWVTRRGPLRPADPRRRSWPRSHGRPSPPARHLPVPVELLPTLRIHAGQVFGGVQASHRRPGRLDIGARLADPDLLRGNGEIPPLHAGLGLHHLSLELRPVQPREDLPDPHAIPLVCRETDTSRPAILAAILPRPPWPRPFPRLGWPGQCAVARPTSRPPARGGRKKMAPAAPSPSRAPAPMTRLVHRQTLRESMGMPSGYATQEAPSTNHLGRSG